MVINASKGIEEKDRISAYLIPAIIRNEKTEAMRELAKAEKIINNICAFLDCPVLLVKGKRGFGEIVYVRHWCCWFLIKETKLSLKRIGELLGGRHHTTALHSKKLVKSQLSSKCDNPYMYDYPLLERIIYNGIQKELGRPPKRKIAINKNITKAKPVRAKAQYSNPDFSKLYN